MNLYEKISILGPSAQYDTCGPKDFGKTTDIPGVYHAKVGGNQICRLFKVLQSNQCKNNCKYCAFRRDRNTARISATPDEMAEAFISAYSRKLVEGLFLSSGVVGNSETTMSRMLDTAHILRDKLQYKGYLHLKLMPGTSSNCIDEAMSLANRISLNIESPTESSLLSISPEKHLKTDFFHTLSLVKDRLKKRKYQGQKIPSLTTQFIVGAGEEKDQEIVKTTHSLYKNFSLARVFYSAFRPVGQTPLADKPPESLTREHRLYQTDFLMRQYRFDPWDIPFDSGGNLFEEVDPKTLWAERNPHYFPININTADYWSLLKVPGIGPTSAKKIIKIRTQSRIRDLDRLLGLRFQIQKMSNYVCW